MQFGEVEWIHSIFFKYGKIVLPVLFVWTVIVLVSFYYRYRYTKVEINKFLKNPKFLESEKDVNPYHEGKFTERKKYCLIKIIFGELWDIYHAKIRQKDINLYNLKIKKIKDQMNKFHSVKNYMLFSIFILSILLGFLAIFNTFDMLSRGLLLTFNGTSIDIANRVLLNHLRDLTPVLTFAIIIILLSVWGIISIKIMIERLFTAITNLELILIEKLED